MAQPAQDAVEHKSWLSEATGPATLGEVMTEIEQEMEMGHMDRFRPLATGFSPLDDVLNGGMRRGELMILGGSFGVGKTTFGLQVARNVVHDNPDARAIYFSYEHDRVHLLLRLLCMESAEQGDRESALTLHRLAELSLGAPAGSGLIAQLRGMPLYGPLLETMNGYADRLTLVKASGETTTLEQMREWVYQVIANGGERVMVVVDYLQKIPINLSSLQPETDVTTYLTQGLKEMAMAMGVHVIAIAASDRSGLKAKRMRLADLRGSSALQYEADMGLIINNKHEIVSREHLVYNLMQAEAMRNWVVISVEKNRAGRHAIDIEHALDTPHFRIVPTGGFVRERLVDEKVITA